MDTVTHTLFGLTLYGSVNKNEWSKDAKKALLFTTIVGSQIPDIDVISQLWDTSGQYQMWHRGITHSIFMVPVWAALIYWLSRFIWGVGDKRLFWMGMLAVFIHNTTDLFNAWGTGYFEPFSSVRITFGTIPIIDFVVWGIMLAGFIAHKWLKKQPHVVYKIVWIFIIAHFAIQTAQGYLIYQNYSDVYDEQALAASFKPWHFTFVGKSDGRVDIYQTTAWGEAILQEEIDSHESANLDLLFEENPEAETLYDWAPFVVIVDDDEVLGLYDPRLFRGGQAILFEFIEKTQDLEFELPDVEKHETDWGELDDSSS
ncbi:metal-dependent hydrolase [Texcoconibacillus texcoconensis]|uniref:Inner membrane protein n=1 Tax=Texcoconibacillus texcoconensis TaxID=1095777 RepID=A0A840QRW7_9BACI|nr:metal-dependent hydrolase [Texcoconibacillus texcoconensis]MBB5174236.1 inner membrane protein [Texcoconibacillus texcoconensis]